MSCRRVARALAICYLLALHAALLLALAKTDLAERAWSRLTGSPVAPRRPPLYDAMLAYHLRMDANVPDGAVIFVGDSITQGLAVSAVARPAVNFGIGGDTTAGAIERLARYASIARAGGIVIALGVNDLASRSNDEIAADFARIADMLPPGVAVVFSGVLPVGKRVAPNYAGVNPRVAALNAALARIAARRPGSVFIDAGASMRDADGDLDERFHLSDGVHLGPAGYRIWIDALRAAGRRAGIAGIVADAR